jgi:iron(III) transport system substrate-binding protein
MITTSEMTPASRSARSRRRPCSCRTHSAAAAADLVLYTSQPNEDAQATVDGFMAANPDIKVDWVRDGTPKIMAKLQAEIQAGNPVADVLLIADTVTLERLKEAGKLLAYKSPEAANYDAALYDADGYLLFHQADHHRHHLQHPAAMKPTSWKDLTKPEAKGLVTMPSPLPRVRPSSTPRRSPASIPASAGTIYKSLRKTARLLPAATARAEVRRFGREGLWHGCRLHADPRKGQGRSRRVRLPERRRFCRDRAGRHPSSAKNADAAKKFVDYVLSEKGQEGFLKLGYIPARNGMKRSGRFPGARQHQGSADQCGRSAEELPIRISRPSPASTARTDPHETEMYGNRETASPPGCFLLS